MAIAKPYLLFVAGATSRTDAKTAIGVAHWRPDDCVGELAYPEATATTGLERIDLEEGVRRGAKTLVLGVANAGGFIEARWIETFERALDAGLDIASGMHARLADVPALAAKARELGRALHDVRVPPKDLPVGSGRPRAGRRVLTVGTDCSVGKMFTALALEAGLRAAGTHATFRATGQTGILIAGTGIAVDAVVADFISGATERLAPAASDPAHVDVVEGQGSLFHPSFAGVSLGLLHGAAPDAMVMCHDPTRTRMRGDVDHAPPALLECIATNESLARLTNPRAKVVGLALNTRELDDAAARAAVDAATADTGLPATDPVRFGVAELVDAIRAHLEATA